MSERLLTDEEIAEAVGHSVLYLRLPVNNMRFADLKVVANAEHKATLKAVGEWLVDLNLIWEFINKEQSTGRDKEVLITAKAMLHDFIVVVIDALLRGEMPEEGK